MFTYICNCYNVSVIKLICAFMQTSNKHLIFFCIYSYGRLLGGCIFPSLCQPVITGKKRKKNENWGSEKDTCLSLFLLSLILVGPFLFRCLCVTWGITCSHNKVCIGGASHFELGGDSKYNACLTPSVLLLSWKNVAIFLKLLLWGNSRVLV